MLDIYVQVVVQGIAGLASSAHQSPNAAVLVQDCTQIEGCYVHEADSFYLFFLPNFFDSVEGAVVSRPF